MLKRLNHRVGIISQTTEVAFSTYNRIIGLLWCCTNYYSLISLRETMTNKFKKCMLSAPEDPATQLN